MPLTAAASPDACLHALCVCLCVFDASIPPAAGFAPSALADGPSGSLAREELSFIMIKPDGVHRGLIAGAQQQQQQQEQQQQVQQSSHAMPLYVCC